MKRIGLVLVAAITACNGPNASTATQSADKVDIARVSDDLARMQMRVEGARARVRVLEDELFDGRVTTVSPTESTPVFAWWCGVSSCTRYQQACERIDREADEKAGVTCRPRRIAWCSVLKIASSEGVQPVCSTSLVGCRLGDVRGGETCLGVE